MFPLRSGGLVVGLGLLLSFQPSLAQHSPEKLKHTPDNGVAPAPLPPGATLRLGEVQLTGTGHVLYAVAFSPDQSLLATGGQDSVLRLWDLHSGRVVKEFADQKYGIHTLQFSPDGRLLAAAGPDGYVRVRGVESGKVLAQLQGHARYAVTLAFSADGKQLATGGEEGDVILWEVSSWKQVRRVSRHEKPIRSVAFAPQGDRILTGSWDRTIALGGLAGKAGLRVNRKEEVNAVAFAPDGRYFVAVCSYDPVVVLYEAATGREVRRFAGHQYSLYAVAFSPDGTTLAAAGRDKSVRVWDVSSGAQVHHFTGHQKLIYSLCYSRDGKWLASGSYDGTALVWAVGR